MTNEQRISLRNRRLLRPVPVCKSAQLCDVPFDYGLRLMILNWIGECTEGEFYMSHSVLYFCDAKDAMAYKLFDVRAKFEMWMKLGEGKEDKSLKVDIRNGYDYR